MSRTAVWQGRRPGIWILAWVLTLGFGGQRVAAQVPDSFTSGGMTFSIERFPKAPDTKKRPVVLLVHGTDGLGHFGTQLRAFAEDLAKQGYLVLLPNYFGTKNNAMKNGTPEEQLQRLTDAIAWAQSRSDADASRTGLVGYSLGAALSLAYAETNPSRIKAVVDHYGPTDDKDPSMSTTLSDKWDILDHAVQLPPTLILHNKKDEIVRIKHSEALDAALLKAGVDHRFISCDDGDPKYGNHPFLADGPEDKAAKDQTVKWLAAHL